MGATDHLVVLASAAPLAASALERSVGAFAKRFVGPFGKTDGGTEGGATQPPTAAETINLLDMALPPDLLKVVGPPLGEYNIRVEPTTKSNAVFKDARMHLAVNGTFSTYLLHFRKEVLENARWAREVIGYSSLFQPGDNVRVLSRECQDFEPAYEWAWKTWSDLGVTTRYVEWRYIARMLKLEEAARAEVLEIAFELPKTLKRRQQLQSEDLLNDSPRITSLVDLIARLGTASGNPDPSAYLNNLLIGSVPQEMRAERTSWGIGYVPAARECLQWLHTKGRRADGDTYLGIVLVTMMDQISVEDGTLIIDTIEQYKLIREAEAVAKLRQKYLAGGRP